MRQTARHIIEHHTAIIATSVDRMRLALPRTMVVLDPSTLDRLDNAINDLQAIVAGVREPADG